ncbi:MAG: D-glycero-beta-D-manno-heptose 1-phosphate adenylyltransferase [SAR116 cluster bacterium]|nr:MAG: D-glycero-beta-D-manno-heptose 1-phosphate adenylyltransferase [SAR116 cluster bacterium]
MKNADIIDFLQSDGLKNLLELKGRIAPPAVFTSGVFDLVHAGHLDYLQAARQLGGSLLVGVNSDNSARKLAKGPSRPFNNAKDRAELIASLRYVDGVIIFGEDTPHQLLKELQPEIFVKGGDYSEAYLRNTDLAGLEHISLKIIPLKTHYSSSNLIEKIVSAYRKETR